MAYHCRLVDSTLDVESLQRLVQSDRDGALVVFRGVVRRWSDDHREIHYLDYECYSDMALSQLNIIASYALEAYVVDSIAVEHRIGRVAIGEDSVVVAVSSPHRAEAFDACRYVIDTLKQDVPIWKKEIMLDGASALRPADSQ